MWKRARWPLLASAAAALLTVPAWAQDVIQRDGVWAQTYVGRPADPAVTFGQLPNGMRYAIQRNNTLAGQLAVRLLIGSGSLAERDNQLGIAHFVEHMAFRGSTHVADGELTRILQRQGLALGPDTNAATSQESTVYQFDFPKSDGASLDSALMLMRETASELIFPQAAVEAERGVVLSEERARDSPAYEAQKALLEFTLAGQLAPRRWPIGSTEIIAHAQPALLRAFYTANYRPDNATLVVVGDVDPAAVEARIRATFSDWKSAGPKVAVETGQIAVRGELVRLFSKPGAPQIIGVTWARPFDRTADTATRERRDVIRLLATTIINRRLQELAQQPAPPFINAGFNRANTARSADLTTIVAVTAPDKWQQGLETLIATQRRFARDGVTQAELGQAEAQLTAYITNVVANAKTRPSPRIANSLVKTANDDSLATSAEQDLENYRADIKKITVAEVSAALRDAFTGSGPLIFASSTQPVVGGETALRATFDTANSAAIPIAQSAAAGTWPYSSFGTPGRVVDRRAIADLGVTTIRFANGNMLTVKPTTFARDEVLIDVEFGQGRAGLPKGLEHAYWLAGGAAPTFVQGGTGKLSVTDASNLLASRIGTIGLLTNDTSYNLQNKTRPQDLEIEMQLLAAYITDPGFRPEAETRMNTALSGALSQIAASPVAVLQRDAARLLHGGDLRWTILPDAADLAASKPGDLKALMGSQLATGRLNVTVVGDITVDAAVKAAAETFGAISARSDGQSSPVETHFPVASSTPIVLKHAGRDDQAIAVVAWPTAQFWGHEKEDRAMTVAMQIIQTRLFDKLRAVDGATYSPSARSGFSTELPGYGAALVQVEIPPTKIPQLETALQGVVDDLVRTPVSDDELARAKRPLIEARRRDLQTNGFWLGALARAARDPRQVAMIRERVEALETVTAADVEHVCSIYLKQKPLRLVVRK